MDPESRSLDSLLDIPTGATAVTHPVVKVQGRHACWREDQLTVEEPLEIRLAGHSLSVTMRTPGHDEELVAGLLFAERLIAGPDDIDLIAHYPGPSEQPELANVMNVLLKGSAPALRDRRPRSFVTSSACGLCGRTTVEDILTNVPPITSDVTVPVELFYGLEPAVSLAQSTFAKTGGLHAAGLFDTDGRLRVLREDVGRHNAVDKVIGHMLRARELPLDRRILLVSGRAGFEILQKALIAGIPIVASVSAPSSLAVQLAMAGGLTLVGFLRRGGLNIYSGAHRIANVAVAEESDVNATQILGRA